MIDLLQPIVPINYPRDRAQREFISNNQRKDNPFPWHSEAHKSYEDEWEKLERAATIGPLMDIAA